MNKLRSIELRISLLCILVFSITGFMSYKLVSIHSLPEEQIRKKAEEITRTYPIKHKRGLILDKRDRVLLHNTIVGDLIADRTHLDDPKIASLSIAYQQLATTDPEWETYTQEKQNKLLSNRRNLILKNIQKQEEKDSMDKMAAMTRLMALMSENSEEAVKESREQIDKEELDRLIATNEEYSADIISQRLNIDKEELLKKIRKKPDRSIDPNKKITRIVLAQNIDPKRMALLRKDLREMKVEGFYFEEKARRTYFTPRSLVHVLGYTDHTGTGQMGIEKSMDRYLSGQDGARRVQVNSRGFALPSSMDKLKPAVHGMNLRLTVDMNLQAIVEEELAAGLKEYESQRGAIIMVDPKTGDIMAMACLPDFDLNERKKEDLLKGGGNYCIFETYEPGSTFKLATVSGALDARKVTLNSRFNCGDRVLKDGPVVLTDSAGYGSRTVQEIITKSSNNGTYLISKTLYRLPLVNYIKSFGFGSKTGIDLSGESSGRIGTGENIVDYSRMAIGYAVNVTPIQIAMAYAAIANNGILMRPRLVDKIFDYNNIPVDSLITEPQIVRRVVSPKAAADMRKALATVTKKGGTGTKAHVPGFTVGGKTGTARKHVPGRGYIDKQYTVSFCGMLPAENPAFVCLVVVDNPRTTKAPHYGGTIAAPIFRKVAERVVEVLKLTPTEPIQELTH